MRIKPTRITTTLRTMLLASMTVLFISCDRHLSNPQNEDSLGLTEVIDIVWTLDSYDVGGQTIPLSSYDPLHLVYRAGHFVGDDGCNSYGGTYEARHDSIFPAEFSMTEMACNTKNFAVKHLTTPYRVQVTEDELEIHSGTSSYTYRSKFTESIANSPLLGREWRLISSNDPEFDPSALQTWLPQMTFDESREFKISWYCDEQNIFECNEVSGIWGLGEDHSILFYRRGSSISGSQGLRLVANILRSSSYDIADGKLILHSENGTLVFEFSQSAPITPNGSVHTVSFLNKGAVVPHPLRTSVVVDQNSITLSSTQDGSIVESWSAPVLAQDFSDLVSIINDNNVIEAPDPVLPEGAEGCIGHQGMTIIMTMDNKADTLNISGLLWCGPNRSFWPVGLVSLVAFQDTLVNKYRP